MAGFVAPTAIGRQTIPQPVRDSKDCFISTGTSGRTLCDSIPGLFDEPRKILRVPFTLKNIEFLAHLLPFTLLCELQGGITWVEAPIF
jgi:hypothetical protein